MKIVQGDQVPDGAGTSHRGGVSSHQYLLDGEPGALNNFSLVLAKSPGRYSPRHRHNFEQFRFQMEGAAKYGRTGKLTPGMVGYYPEGASYGPQTQEDGVNLAVLVLQCGGASGEGYLSRAEQAIAIDDLNTMGDFKDGVFFRNEDVPGKRNMDAFQAVWEHVNKRPMVYPKPRYDNPILMQPENYKWTPLVGAPGVSQRQLGDFTECHTRVGFLKIDPDTKLKLTGGRDIYFVVSGAGTVDGETLRPTTTVYLDDGEQARLSADESTGILHFHLPEIFPTY